MAKPPAKPRSCAHCGVKFRPADADGRVKYCSLECKVVARRKYLRAYMPKWRDEHPHHLAWQRDWNRKNITKVHATQKRWRDRHPGYAAERSAAWREKRRQERQSP